MDPALAGLLLKTFHSLGRPLQPRDCRARHFLRKTSELPNRLENVGLAGGRQIRRRLLLLTQLVDYFCVAQSHGAEARRQT
jgi:hypothetical protein